jgi:hypothetical protein
MDRKKLKRRIVFKKYSKKTTVTNLLTLILFSGGVVSKQTVVNTREVLRENTAAINSLILIPVCNNK